MVKNIDFESSMKDNQNMKNHCQVKLTAHKQIQVHD